MNYCSNCGEKINSNEINCSKCGQPLQNNNPNDTGSIGLVLLGFFVPLIGMILFIAWHNSYPKKSKSCGKGALIGFILSIIIAVLLFGFYIYSFSINNNGYLDFSGNESSSQLNNEQRQGTQSLGNLKNTRFHYYDTSWVGNKLIAINESIEFGNGNYVFNSETSSVGDKSETKTEIGTFSVSGDNVTLTSSDGNEKIGILVGRSLTINGRTYR